MKFNKNSLVRVIDDAPLHAGIVGAFHVYGEGKSNEYGVLNLSPYKDNVGPFIAVKLKYLRHIYGNAELHGY